jgi:hypothetical protein
MWARSLGSFRARAQSDETGPADGLLRLRFDSESQSSIKYSLLWRRLDRLLFSLDGK